MSKLLAYKITRWSSNPLSLGSYSFFKVGSTADDCENLRKNIDERIFFAGEAMYAKMVGTVHGAFKTGTQAGEEVCKILQK